MKIGINASAQIRFSIPVDGLIEHARAAEADGFSSYWLNQTSGADALAVLGRATERVGRTRPPAMSDKPRSANSRREVGVHRSIVIGHWAHPLMTPIPGLGKNIDDGTSASRSRC